MEFFKWCFCCQRCLQLLPPKLQILFNRILFKSPLWREEFDASHILLVNQRLVLEEYSLLSSAKPKGWRESCEWDMVLIHLGSQTAGRGRHRDTLWHEWAWGGGQNEALGEHKWRVVNSIQCVEEGVETWAELWKESTREWGKSIPRGKG